MSDNLDVMFVMQEALMKKYAERDETFPAWPIDFSDKKQQKFVHDVLVNAVSEIFEATRELKNTKQHRQTNITDFDKPAFLEECVDVQKYLIEAMILADITPADFYKAYCDKDAVCHERISSKY